MQARQQKRVPTRGQQPRLTGAGIAAAGGLVLLLSVERLFWDFPDWVWWITTFVALIVVIVGLAPLVRVVVDHSPRVYAPRRWNHLEDLADHERRVEQGIGNYVRVLDRPSVSQNHLEASDPWFEIQVSLSNPTPWDLQIVGVSGSATIANTSKKPLSLAAEHSGGGELKSGSTESLRVTQSVYPDTAKEILDQNSKNSLRIRLGEIQVVLKRVGDNHEFRPPLTRSVSILAMFL